MSISETLVLIMYALIGITGALSVMAFVSGLTIYLVRLGTERRIRGIRIMEWGVGFIVMCLVLIGVLRLLE